MIEIGKTYQIEHTRQGKFQGFVTAVDGEYASVDLGDQKNRLVVGDRYVRDAKIEVLIAKSRFTELKAPPADLGKFDGKTH